MKKPTVYIVRTFAGTMVKERKLRLYPNGDIELIEEIQVMPEEEWQKRKKFIEDRARKILSG